MMAPPTMVIITPLSLLLSQLSLAVGFDVAGPWSQQSLPTQQPRNRRQSPLQHQQPRHNDFPPTLTTRLSLNDKDDHDDALDAYDDAPVNVPSRRRFFTSIVASSVITSISSSFTNPALAAPVARSTADAVVTDKIFIEFKGIPPATDSSTTTTSDSSSATSSTSSSASSGDGKDRIVIGLFGNDAPQPVSILKQLVTKPGYKSKCKPLDTSRLLQKEQLEANKVYNSCLETEDTLGVTYDLSSVWRIIPNQRIDLGSVSGKFVARENPNFEENASGPSGLTHDMPGVVSVRRGDDGGFGFTIYPGTGSNVGAQILDEDNIVVGRILSGMDVLQRLNGMPVVKSAGVNYMALTGGPNVQNAPSRACRYGGPMYCNENKPLRKVLIESTGIL